MRAAVAMLLLLAQPLLAQQAGDPEVEPMAFPSSDTRSTEPQPTASPASEQVVAGLSSDAVDINTSFDGSEIILYGAVRRETEIPSSRLHVVATIQGPSRSVTVRRKERRLGIWVNTESVVVGAAPSYYAVATTAPLDKILLPEEDARYRISIPMAMRAFARPLAVDDPTKFTEAMLRQRVADGSYRLDERAVALVRDTLFRADFALPANIVEGGYKTRIFLLRDGRVIDAYSAPLDVEKVGLERWLYRLAFDQPLFYGLMSLLIAAAAGWAASAAFRAIQSK